jgi:hypothetical protein
MSRETIIVEDRLRDIFKYLKPIVGSDSEDYYPIFKGGDEEELYAFFMESLRNVNYPLIWLVMPYEENHTNRGKSVVNLTLILAVETSPELRTSERMDLVFKPRLYPLLDNILDCLRVSNISSIDGDYTIIKYPNYKNSVDKDGSVIDVWDAIRLEVEVTFNDKCLREIKT